ncbi:FtsX-like permease family protein [Halovulum dunhuangense]|uniref:FtsX-like permease family protein n=1 Tax=Halovulum dunhuangense TaxID=1505036 RepID=A0A849L5F1_9RHOB|nr:FtsX-like permease family protein [Halovulum dunhuangense]NNU81410.1 FtsX-like permease family protein [Halovulum dunhuangense]
MTGGEFRTAARIAARELRGGLRGFRIFLVCLALGVAAIAAVGSVRSAITSGLEQEASALLGGDAEMRFTYRFASDEERAWMDANAARVSEIVDFRSLATAEVDGERVRGLSQVKGVDGAYPLYGTVRLEPEIPLSEALAGRDGLPGMVMDPVLVARMGLKVGDAVRLGTRDFALTAALTAEPDGITAGFTVGPRIIVLTEALRGSGLLAEGTLFDSAYRLATAPDTDIATLEREARGLFRDTGMRWRDSLNGTPGVSRFVDRLSAFLVLVGLAGLAVGGVGVSAAVRSYLEGKTETIATLKTLGARGDTIFAIYLMQIGALALVGVGIGLALGAAVPLLVAPLIADRLPLPADFGLYATPLLEAAFYGLMTALVFTLWPLARARDVRAAGLFRELGGGGGWPARRFVLLLAAIVALFVATVIALSDVPRLASWSAAGIVAALGVLLLAARGARSLARRASHGGAARGRPALRLALGAVGGPGGETASVTLSLGLGLSVLAAIGQVDYNLRSAIQQDLPEIAPAYFFVDIQPDQLDGFMAANRETDGVGEVETAPMLRGVITRINDQPAAEYVRAQTGDGHWALRGDRGVTYAATPPAGTQIVEGEWWPEDYAGPPVMSFAEEEAREMGLRLGDRVTVNILGRDLTAELTSLRVVEFDDMGINFLMALNPGALAGAPHTHIATVYAEPSAEAPLLRRVADAYPNITAIGVRDAIDRVAEALDGISAATRYGAAATLLTGFMVLIGAAAAGERRRVFEAAVLKTLGATRGRILQSFALRAAMLGATAGMVAIIAGALAGWGVTTFVMETEFRFAALQAVAIVLGGATASLLAGLAFALRPLRARPARVLRAQD